MAAGERFDFRLDSGISPFKQYLYEIWTRLEIVKACLGEGERVHFICRFREHAVIKLCYCGPVRH